MKRKRKGRKIIWKIEKGKEKISVVNALVLGEFMASNIQFAKLFS